MVTSVYSVVIDLTLVAVVGLAVLLLNLLGRPYRRGFYCNDESIYYPYHGNTVSTVVIAIVGLAAPAVVISVREWFSNKGDFSHKAFIGNRGFPRMIVRVLRLYGVFLFGAGISQMIVDIAKYWVGRLRPHFMAVCQPDTATLCSHEVYNYITEYTCQGEEQDAIEEARLSFPSGHSALAFYAAVFTVMYLQCEPRWKWGRLLRHFLQVCFLLAAWWTALTRVSDYFHHWGDVLAGMIIGSLVAVLNVVFVSDLHCCGSRTCRQDHLPLMTNLSNPSSYSVTQRGDSNNV